VEQKTYIRIPEDRVGVLIGPRGRVKRRIETTFMVSLTIDSESGSVEITPIDDKHDVSKIFTARNVVQAIGRGFSPHRALRLMDEDYDMIVLDLADYVGDSRNAQSRVKGRIIGKGGKSRQLLEELTECQVSVYGGTVAIIGTYEMIPVAKEAVEMLIRGAFHKTVWNHLYAYRRKMKKEKGELWYEPPRSRENS
jgi:ribosomal RNA assembly protein